MCSPAVIDAYFPFYTRVNLGRLSRPNRAGSSYSSIPNNHQPTRGGGGYRISLSGPVQLLGTFYTIAHGDVLELKVPLELLDNPSHVSVGAFAMAVENGSEKPAKGFRNYGEVLSPGYTIYLPQVARR